MTVRMRYIISSATGCSKRRKCNDNKRHTSETQRQCGRPYSLGSLADPRFQSSHRQAGSLAVPHHFHANWSRPWGHPIGRHSPVLPLPQVAATLPPPRASSYGPSSRKSRSSQTLWRYRRYKELVANEKRGFFDRLEAADASFPLFFFFCFQLSRL